MGNPVTEQSQNKNTTLTQKRNIICSTHLLTHKHSHTHTSARCCGLLTLISAVLARTPSSVSTTSVSLGEDQQRRQECLRREEREHSFFQSAFPPSCPPSHDPSIFSCCTAGSSIASLASCLYTAEEAELPLWTCVSWSMHTGRMHQCENGKRGGWVRVKAAG